MRPTESGILAGFPRPPPRMRQHLIELILFSTYAELRAEAARSYLGLIWWVIEPAMMMGAFWLVFDVILKTGGPDYLPFLLIGLTLWQWMKSCITHGGYAIWGNLAMVRQVRLPPLVFPLVAMLSDTVKFVFIFALLLVILWCAGYPPNAAYWALPIAVRGDFPGRRGRRFRRRRAGAAGAGPALRHRAGADGGDVPVRRRVPAGAGAAALQWLMALNPGRGAHGRRHAAS